MNRTNYDGAQRLLTREAFRLRLEERGETVTDWASKHGFSREQVYAFLAGRTKGKRGVSHHLAIAVGVKASPGDDSVPALERSKLTSGTEPSAPPADKPSVSLAHRRQEPKRSANNPGATLAVVSVAPETMRTEP